MKMKMLQVKKVTKIYGSGHTAVKALDSVSMDVEQGEITLIMGPSGSGKTTLLSIAGCLLKPTSGSVKVMDMETTKLSELKLPKIRLRHIGFVFQNFNLLSALNAAENVMVPLELAGAKDKAARKKAAQLLESFGLKKRMHALPQDLSGGEKQRVAVARALVNDPCIILADEPTANLDSKNGRYVMELFRKEVKEEGRSAVIVSHDERLKDIADRTLYIEDGKLKKN